MPPCDGSLRLVCGICGILRLDDVPVDMRLLHEMNAGMFHRGPDSEGSMAEGPVGLAMRRLSIIDLAGGDQPIANEDGSIHVVQNGEIYNFRELRRTLERTGHSFRTRSDTEVLVHLYEEHGPGFVRELRGMFAIALWDSRRRRLVLARDPFGIKPLYYNHADRELSFASELKALVRNPRVTREIDPDALEAFLAFNWIPGPLTIFRGVRKLLPGHVLVAEKDRITTERYARPGVVPGHATRRGDESAMATELLETLRDSVRAHLVADVPVGVLLSGGIDSSALVALAAQESAERVRTFSIGFEERSYNELASARLVAQRYDTSHHELVVRPNAVELLPALVEAFDEPFGDSSALPTYLVSQLARTDVKVALSGEGGDELFGGYYTYVADQLAGRLRYAAMAARPFVERLPSSTEKVSFDYKAKRFVRAAHLPALERHHAWKEIFSAKARAELLAEGKRAQTDPLDAYRERYAQTAGAQALARFQDLDLGIYLVDDLLVKVDRASMAHSLETRVPFLDPVVAELALAVPDSTKVRGFATKRLLRRAVAPLLPTEVLRAKKQGFSIPAAAWFRGPLEPFARDVLSPSVVTRQGFFRPAAVTALIDRHVQGREDLSRQIWNVLAFTLWYERYVVESDSVTSGQHLRAIA